MKELSIINGGVATDGRGQIRFVNDFDMSLVKRFYIIKNSDIKMIRGWRAHQIEQRWFYVLKGAFSIRLIKINDWHNPDPDSLIQEQILKAQDMQVFHVPAGYATALRALEAESEVIVFADYPITHAVMDDHTWPLDFFKNMNF